MSLHVLLADDDPAIRTVITLNLRRRGWTVEAAEDGQQALERANGGQHDALVLDQRMPRLTGLEVAERLERSVPTVIYSAYLDADLQQQAEALGCRTMRKADVAELLALLERVADGRDDGGADGWADGARHAGGGRTA